MEGQSTEDDSYSDGGERMLGRRCAMYWLKACPRCAGDLREEEDIHGGYVDCIQCGYVLHATEERVLHLVGTGQREMVRPQERAA
jgi:hypothetical protein